MLLFASLPGVVLGCGSSSSEPVNGAGGAATTGSGGMVATGGTSNTGGTTGTGGSTGTGGATGTGGTTGTGGSVTTGAGGSPGNTDCPALSTYTVADHIILPSTWPASAGTVAGSGPVHIWDKTTFVVNGNDLSATSQACGIVLPDATLNALAGGQKFHIDVPDAAWDAPTMPRFQFHSTQTGWNPGSMTTWDATAIIGVTIDAAAAWPASGAGLTTTDADGDMNPGYTGAPRNGNGYVMPPTSLLMTARADKVYLVSRNIMTLNMTRTACDRQSGTVTVKNFDSHVVGCHVSGGQACMPGEVDFIDSNRTKYTATTGTIDSVTVPATSTCQDVRNTLPM